MGFEKLLLIAGCFCIASFSSCTAYVNKVDGEKISEMVKAGSNPIAARCAIKGIKNNGCVAYIAKD